MFDNGKPNHYSQSVAAKKTSILFARVTPTMVARLDAVRGDESTASMIRRLLEREVTRLEREAMRAAAEARNAAAPADRAELEPYAAPTRAAKP